MSEKNSSLRSGASIKLELGENFPKTSAGKLELITILLGNEPIYDEDFNEIGRTEPMITKEEALKLLNGETL